LLQLAPKPGFWNFFGVVLFVPPHPFCVLLVRGPSAGFVDCFQIVQQRRKRCDIF
jgi:hypothetical protein